ncbi:AI-2E family transporter [Clostridium pasteurianum]|uniref:Putative permease n=1 Tax=Clostridium pasteurianum BC1 TaxID=86416 RepID=R4K9R0_CLOPA|nr:AI-2E family transporter [Clostridium pasteurianum]AGK97269.1 putative permease [Clostridium pasteurianum BC1]
MKNKLKYIIIILIIFILAYIFYTSEIIRNISYILFISFIVAYMLKPFNDYLVRRGIKKEIASIILLLGVCTLIVGSIVFLIPAMLKESTSINKTSREILKYITIINEKIKLMRNNHSENRAFFILYNKINYIVKGFVSGLIEMSMKIGQNLLAIAVIPVISYYFLSDSNNIKNKFLILFGVKWRNIIRKTMEDIDKNLSRYIVGQLTLSLIISILTFTILFSLKVDYPIILSVLNGVFNIIPYFGPIFGAIPAIVVAFMESPREALWTAIWLYILQLIEGNIICPKITGDSINMHPLLVIVLLLIGEKLGGFTGMILIIPISVVIKVIYEDLNYYLY